MSCWFITPLSNYGRPRKSIQKNGAGETDKLEGAKLKP